VGPEALPHLRFRLQGAPAHSTRLRLPATLGASAVAHDLSDDLGSLWRVAELDHQEFATRPDP
jgi:hypothetical protein